MYRAAFDRRKHGLVDDQRISLFFDFSIRGQLQQIMPGQVNFHPMILGLMPPPVFLAARSRSRNFLYDLKHLRFRIVDTLRH
jgi:hypothetical protein